MAERSGAAGPKSVPVDGKVKGLSSRHASGSFRRNTVSAGQLDYGARGLADARRGRSRASCPLGRSTMTGPGLGPPVQGFSPAAPAMFRLVQGDPRTTRTPIASCSFATALTTIR